MRYGIFGDVHSNLEALEAVLGAFHGASVDRFLSMGDLVGYGADPRAVLERVRGLELQVSAGNHDWATAGVISCDRFNEAARVAVEWTQGALNDDEKAYLRALPLTVIGNGLTLAHGTLSHPELFRYLLDRVTACDQAELMTTPILFVGHTHLPVVYEIDARRDRCRTTMLTGDISQIKLRKDRRYVINVGSVGQPRDGDPRASCGILDSEDGTLEVIRLEYDVETAQRKIRQAGLPEKLAARLEAGW